MLPRWRWSIRNAVGRVTETDLMLASPGRVRRSKTSCGFVDFLVPFPVWPIVVRGLKGRFAQLTAWNGDEKSVTVPWSPMPSESTVKFEQLVGLIVNSGRSMLTWIDRMRIGTPPMILGTRSEI